MAKEAFIKGKHDNGHHDGKVAHVRREQEADAHLKQELQSLFEDMHGITLQQAIEFGGMNNDLGEQWRRRIQHFTEMLTKPSRSI